MVGRTTKTFLHSLLFLLCIVSSADNARAEVPSREELLNRFQNGVDIVKDSLRRSAQFSKVEVAGNYKLSAPAVVNQLHAPDGVWIWDLWSGKLEEELLKEPWIHSAELKWEGFPARLQIEIEESEPWFICHVAGFSWLVSRQGKLIAPLQSVKDPDLVMDYSELPRVEFEVPSSGRELAGLLNSNFEQLSKALKVVEAAGSFPFQIDYYAFTYDGAFIAKPEDSLNYPEVVFRVETFVQTAQAIKQLRVVLSDLATRNEKPTKIDLRYGRQVIVGLQEAPPPVKSL